MYYVGGFNFLMMISRLLLRFSSVSSIFPILFMTVYNSSMVAITHNFSDILERIVGIFTGKIHTNLSWISDFFIFFLEMMSETEIL